MVVPAFKSQLPITEHQYTSQISDLPQTNLYYYNARYYFPGLGLFTQADTHEGPNRYAYVNGNPIRYTDPSGNFKPIPPTVAEKIKKMLEPYPDEAKKPTNLKQACEWFAAKVINYSGGGGIPEWMPNYDNLVQYLTPEEVEAAWVASSFDVNILNFGSVVVSSTDEGVGLFRGLFNLINEGQVFKRLPTGQEIVQDLKEGILFLTNKSWKKRVSGGDPWNNIMPITEWEGLVSETVRIKGAVRKLPNSRVRAIIPETFMSFDELYELVQRQGGNWEDIINLWAEAQSRLGGDVFRLHGTESILWISSEGNRLIFRPNGTMFNAGVLLDPNYIMSLIKKRVD